MTTELREALIRLTLEAIHYRNTGIGKQFLTAAIDHANDVLADESHGPHCTYRMGHGSPCNCWKSGIEVAS